MSIQFYNSIMFFSLKKQLKNVAHECTNNRERKRCKKSNVKYCGFGSIIWNTLCRAKYFRTIGDTNFFLFQFMFFISNIEAFGLTKKSS